MPLLTIRQNGFNHLSQYKHGLKYKNLNKCEDLYIRLPSHFFQLR